MCDNKNIIFLCTFIIFYTFAAAIKAETTIESDLNTEESNVSDLLSERNETLHISSEKVECEADFYCWNGGKCVNNSCKCLPGTSGYQCAIVDACDTDDKTRKECGDPEDVFCDYNVTTHDHFCHCRIIEYFYDPYDSKCKGCDCGPDGNCSFVEGLKTCDCKEGYARNDFDYKFDFGNFGECEDCKCGEHSNGCAFVSRYIKECNCSEGYSQDYYDKCERCDCGPNGKCRFDVWSKICDCDRGFENNGGTCEDCFCGRHGNCSFKNGKKICACENGYAVDDYSLFGGKCRWCNCFLGQQLMNCTFASGVKQCLCPTGYQQHNDACIDIDECLKHNACPSNSICVNTPGNYECHCKEGYQPYNEDEIKIYGCLDINECVESLPCPFTDTTECVNTPGSYMCVCKKGYLPQSFYIESEKYAGCIKDQSSWKYGYAVLIVCFSIISMGFLYGICRRYRTSV